MYVVQYSSNNKICSANHSRHTSICTFWSLSNVNRTICRRVTAEKRCQHFRDFIVLEFDLDLWPFKVKCYGVIEGPLKNVFVLNKIEPVWGRDGQTNRSRTTRPKQYPVISSNRGQVVGQCSEHIPNSSSIHTHGVHYKLSCPVCSIIIQFLEQPFYAECRGIQCHVHGTCALTMTCVSMVHCYRSRLTSTVPYSR